MNLALNPRLVVVLHLHLLLPLCVSAQDLRKGGSIFARVEANGDVRMNGRLVGKVESDGDIRKAGQVIGRTASVRKEHAAAIFFFGFFDEQLASNHET